jgi:hypothetical protein
VTEYQERPGADLGVLAFVLAVLGLSLPLYGLLVAWRFAPPLHILHAPSVPVGPALFGLAVLSYVSRRVRRARWALRALPVVAAALATCLLPERLPLLSPAIGFRIHGVFSEMGALRLLVPSALHALAGACLVALPVAAWLRRRRRASVATVAHGSARWATEREAR